MMTITLYTTPVPINRKFFIVRGRNILSKRYREAKIALAAEIAGEWTTAPLSTPVELNIKQYFGDKRRRDIDAHLKILLDAMEGIVYDNDNQIFEMHVTKNYDKENPRVEITICK